MGGYDEVKRLLSAHSAGIVCDDMQQRGKLDNEFGRFEFSGYGKCLEMDSFGIAMSFRQDMNASIGFLSRLLEVPGLFASNGQTMETIRG